jgi:hypothetical protein
LETINAFITSQTHVTAAGIAAIIASGTAASNSVGNEEPVKEAVLATTQLSAV